MMKTFTNYNIGDKVYCYYSDDNDEHITKYKIYQIIDIDDEDTGFVIYDDNSLEHTFTFEKCNKWFCSLKELRKQKLEKLNWIQ